MGNVVNPSPAKGVFRSLWLNGVFTTDGSRERCIHCAAFSIVDVGFANFRKQSL